MTSIASSRLMQTNSQPKNTSTRPMRPTSTTRVRHTLIFVIALTTLCVALITCVVLLTMIFVRRHLQQQQQQHDVTDDEYDDATQSSSYVPPNHKWSSSSTLANVNTSGRHRHATDVTAKDDSVLSTLPSRLAVFRALQTAPGPTDLPTSNSSTRRRQSSRRRRPNSRRHRGRQHHRHNGDKVVAGTAELRRLARIALKRHLRTANADA